MKTAKLYLTVVSLLALLVSNVIGAAWTGSMSEPENMKKIDGKAFYIITTADELAWFANQVNSGKSTINAILGDDIVFGKDKNTVASINWTPIGKDTKYQFAGILDGAGHTIYGMSSTGLALAGLFGVLNTDGIVRNLKTNAGYVSGFFRIGGVIAHNDGTIQNVENNNKIEVAYKSGDSVSIYIGGIAGHNNGTIITSSNKASVSNKAPTALTGGIVGKNSGLIENSGNMGGVSSIIYKTGARYEAGSSDGIYSGGIVGLNTGSINKVKNIGSVSADGHIVYYKDMCVGCNIEQARDVYRKTYSGGVVGLSLTTISNGINDGKITNSNKENRFINGIIASGKAKNSIDLQSLKYWLNETEVQGTAENMQKDQFAWILNTTNGTESNSGMWTRTTGYPDFANEVNLPIYRIVFNDDGATSNRYTNNKGLAQFPDNPEPAEGLLFMGWYNVDDTRVKPTMVFSADQIVKAVYTDASDVFWTITFYNAAPADTVLESKSYQHGSIVTYGGVAPTLTSSAQYIYSFKGWDVEPTNAVEDFEYHAVYDSTIRSYTVTFNNTDGSKIESATFEYGKMPSCSETPTRDATAEWKYSHKGWKPALDYVTEAATYTAIYDSSKVEYKVTFMNGVTVIDEQMVPYGDAAVAPTNVTREGYKFTGWNTSFTKVTENLTVKALFEEIPVYIVKVVDSEGVKIDSTKVMDGKTYTLPSAPKKEDYTFDAYYNGDKKLGVAGDVISISANITITAKYTKNPKSSSSSTPKSSSSVKSSSSAKSSSSQVKSSSSSVVKSSSSSSKKVSSSSSVKSSSSQGKSSSSKKSNAVVSKQQTPKFSIQVQVRSIQISAAPMNSVYAIFDMQGRVLKNGRVSAANFNIALPRAGSYLVKIEEIKPEK